MRNPPEGEYLDRPAASIVDTSDGAGLGTTGLARGRSSFATQKGTQMSATAQPPVRIPGRGGLSNRRIANTSGAFAVIGGAAWTAAALIHAAQPQGCIGDECDIRPMRDSTTATELLLALAGVTMIGSGAGLLALHKRQNGLAWPGRLGAALCALGVVSLALAVAVQELFFGGDFPWMPAFVVPGVIALAVGLAFVGWTVFRSRILPAWLRVALLSTALLLLGANEQTSRILLVIPFGLAWAAMGVMLLPRPELAHQVLTRFATTSCAIVHAICLRFAHPNLSGLSGGLVWAAATAIAHPDLAEPGEPGLTAGNWVDLVRIALVGLVIAYGISRWAWSGSSRRLGGAAGVLAVAAALMVVAPWSGWPHIFAGTALGLVVEHHHRTGAWVRTTGFAAVLAGLGFSVATAASLVV